MGINPQIMYPKRYRKYCEQCKVLLADGYIINEKFKKTFLCNRCLDD